MSETPSFETMPEVPQTPNGQKPMVLPTHIPSVYAYVDAIGQALMNELPSPNYVQMDELPSSN